MKLKQFKWFVFVPAFCVLMVIFFQTSIITATFNAEADYLNPNFATYIGSSGNDYSRDVIDLAYMDMAVDTQGNIIVAGRVTDNDFPIKNGLFANTLGNKDAFIAKFSSNGSVIWSTYLGGSADEWITNIALDQNDNIVVCGTTGSSNFPTTIGALSRIFIGGSLTYDLDAFVSKISSDGQTLLYSTFIGGSEADWGYGVDINANNEIVITGSTYSTDIQMVNSYQSTHGADGSAVDNYIVKINSTGNGIAFSTYLGGTGNHAGKEIRFDADNNILVSGLAMSSSYPTKDSLFSYAGQTMGFLTRFYSNYSLDFSTLFGGNGRDNIFDFVLLDDKVVFCGSTTSTNLPTVNAFQTEYGAGAGGFSDAFVSILDFSGPLTLTFSTYIGGDSEDIAYGIAVDDQGLIYITGSTYSTNYPTNNPLIAEKIGDTDAFLSIIMDNGSLIYSSYLGGTDTDYGYSIKIGSGSDILLTGHTKSTNLAYINSENSYQSTNAGSYDAFLVVFSRSEANNTTLTSSTTKNGEAKSSPGFQYSGIIVSFISFFLIRKRK